MICRRSLLPFFNSFLIICIEGTSLVDELTVNVLSTMQKDVVTLNYLEKEREGGGRFAEHIIE